MAKFIPAPTPQLNRLRAAAALIPLIESGIADGSFSSERIAQMLLFCEWAIVEVTPAQAEEQRLMMRISDGLQRLKGDIPLEMDAAPFIG